MNLNFLTKLFPMHQLLLQSLVCASIAVPHSIAAENISVSFAAESNALHIQIKVSPGSFYGYTCIAFIA